ncbi:hypothetical protein [Planctomyces sp. SH-PL62]|uniref:hypothetical protein n=1 Tax=Planctomyces sp. SH-PL62 TaxID=1636152 RepID=UPI00078DF8CF|nr:hypothetical protein [Planctomyces sp. SH-PL62]AMV40896.1 hypothetical protein VT85_25910 [Planctomyces sp. SH-PL62]
MSIGTADAPAGPDLEAQFDAIRSRAVVAAVAGLVACLVGGLAFPRSFYPAYLTAFLFWAGLSVASIGLCFLHRLVGGGWALPLRRPFEAAGAMVVPMAVLFVPILLGLPYAFPWADEGVRKANPMVAQKAAIFLYPSFFATRAAIYFALWAVAAYLVNAWSRQQDRSESLAPSRRLTAVAGPALVLMFLSASFAAFDWGMSRDPDWYSTIYGAMYIVGMILSTLAFLTVFTIRIAGHQPVRSALSAGRLNDIGNLLLAFTMLWAYMSISQFLIIWLGNLPEEVIWYLRRIEGVWGAVALGLIFFGFFAPFLALLRREHKRDASWVLPIASWLVVMRVVDLAWLILPGYAKPGETGFPWASLPWLLAALAGIGGVWMIGFVGRLRSAPLVPLRDPRILDALALEAAHQHNGGAVL